MAWVLLDDNFPNHPKAIQAGPVASYLFVCGLCYCRKYHTGGFIPEKVIGSLGVARKPTAMIAALVAAGLWDLADGGYLVHDYDGFYADEQDKAAKHDAISEKRRSAGKRGAEARWQTHSFANGTDGVVRSGSSDHFLEEKKREADFGAFWDRYPRKDGKQAARGEWVKLKPTDDEQRIISADLERRCQSAQWLKDGGQFIPHARTYLHQRRFEDGFVERPRLAERTINVLKGFEEPEGSCDVSGVSGAGVAAGGATGSRVRPADVEVVSPRVIDYPHAAPQRRS